MGESPPNSANSQGRVLSNSSNSLPRGRYLRRQQSSVPSSTPGPAEEPGESPLASPTGRGNAPSSTAPCRGRSAPRSKDSEAEVKDDEPRKKRKKRKKKVVINTTFCKYDVVRKVATDLDMVEDRDEDGEKGEFNLFWTDTSVAISRVMRLQNWQRINHFPSMHLISRKVHLSTTLGKMRKAFPLHFSFFPRTWSLKSERNQFRKYISTLPSKRTFIVKPSAGCQGKGILLTQDPLELSEDMEDAVVQEYITKPLLIEEKKFDLRVYVLVTSVKTPSIFVYHEGLVRLCTVDYVKPSEENLENVQMHLTNYAINKTSENFIFNDDSSSGDTGHKRDFAFLSKWLKSENHDAEKVWSRIDKVIVKTLLAAQPMLAHVYTSCFPHNNDGYTCFEILGFDLLLDQNLKPWLLEVNHSPSFNTDTPLDERVKSSLITEAMRILNLKADDRYREREREREEFRRRMDAQTRRSLAKKAGEDGDAERRELERERLEFEEAEKKRMEELVAARRTDEDSLLVNFRRVYPSKDAERQALYEEFIEGAREVNIPSSTVATLQREQEGKREREKQREKQAHEEALRRGLQRPKSPSKKDVPRPTVPDNRTDEDRPWRAPPPRRCVSEEHMKLEARRQQRLDEQMERHKRRISLGPRLSVFQLRDQYLTVPPGPVADPVYNTAGENPEAPPPPPPPQPPPSTQDWPQVRQPVPITYVMAPAILPVKSLPSVSYRMNY